MDWQSLLYGPVYTILGETAVLTVDALSDPVSLTYAVDKTAGIEISANNDRAELSIQTLTPAVAVRMADITDAGLTRANLEGGTIAINGATWRIESSRPRPSPQGEAEGELLLLLSES